MEGENETLLEFPCDFSVKAMGRNEPGFEVLVLQLVRRHAPDIHEGSMRTRSSKGGKWVSVTVTLRAESKAQLDAIYFDLTAHEKVEMAL